MAEFVIFAAPAIFILGYFATILGSMSAGSLLVNAPSALLGGGVREVQMTIFAAIGVGLTVFGFMAFQIFLNLSFKYMRGRLEAQPQTRRRYWRGLFYAAIPIVVIGYPAVASGDFGPLSPFPLFFLGGLTLLVPATHLGIVLHLGNAAAPS